MAAYEPQSAQMLFTIAKAFLLAATGFAWLSLSGLSRRTNLLEKIVLAITLGLTSAIIGGSIAIVEHFSLDFVSYGLLLVTILAIAAACLLRRPKLELPRTNVSSLRSYLLPVSLFAFHLTLWASYLANYPYFPNSDAIDVVWHSDITGSILQGRITSPVAEAGFPTGTHIMFAFVSAYFGVDVLSSLRITTALVEATSVLIAYCLFQRLLPNGRASTYAAVSFSLIIPAGLVYYTRIGAYPNIVGDFFVLASLLAAVLVSEKLTWPSVLTAVLVQSTALVSHVSVPIVAALLLGFSLVVFNRFRPHIRAYVVSNLGFFLLPTVALIVAPRTVERQFGYVSTQYLELYNDMGLVLQQWVHNFLLFVGPLNFILLFAALGLAAVVARRRIWPMFLAVWFAALTLAVFVSTNDWRLILLSLVPGSGLLGLLLSKIHESLEASTLRRTSAVHTRRVFVTFVMVLIIVLLSAGGPTAFALNETLARGQASRQIQIHESILWLDDNSPPRSPVISVGLWQEYRYLPIVSKLSFRGDFNLKSSAILKLRENFVFRYVAVSTDFYGLETFFGSDSFKVRYANPAVVIFETMVV